MSFARTRELRQPAPDVVAIGGHPWDRPPRLTWTTLVMPGCRMNKDTAPANPLLLSAGFALGIALLLQAALEVSTNPVPGDSSYDVTAWVADLLQTLAVGLFSAWAAVRTLLRVRG